MLLCQFSIYFALFFPAAIVFVVQKTLKIVFCLRFIILYENGITFHRKVQRIKKY